MSVATKVILHSIGGLSTNEKIFLPIVLTLMLGSVYNAATSNVAYSSGFKFTDLILNPHSPFTFLLNGNFLGFVASFFPTDKQSVSPIIIATFQMTSCTFDFTIPFIETANIAACTAPANFGFVGISPSGTPSPGQAYIGCVTASATVSIGGTQVVDHTAPSGQSQISLSCAPLAGQVLPLGNSATKFDMTCIETAITAAPTDTDILNRVVQFGGFVLSFALIVLSFGLRIGILTNTIAANDQGTKMAQAYGFGLMAWTITSSEFGKIWTNDVWPFGIGELLYFVLPLLMVIGLWERSQTTVSG